MTPILWMVHSALIAGLLAAAAFLLERAALAAGRPVRGIWASALALAVLLPAGGLAVGTWGGAAPAGAEAMTGPGAAAYASGEVSSVTLRNSERSGIALLRAPFRTAGNRVSELSTRIAGVVPSGVEDRTLFAGWIGGAGLLLLFGAIGSLRLWRIRGRWPRATVIGEEVRISPELGPAVVGLVRPEIVLPRWLVSAPPSALRLILLHEREHIRRRDSLLLAVGAVASALVFWNPAVWWIFARLRGAVELDCDRRVLRTGVSRRDYGRLLLEVGGRSAALPFPLAALAEPSSLLERRLRQMKRIDVRGSLGTALGAGALALLLVVVACESETPAALGPAEVVVPVAEMNEAAVEETTPPSLRVVGEAIELAAEGAAPPPLFIVDGVIVSETVAQTGIRELDIESIEVVKGAAARALYGSRAAGGVILITTRDREH